MNLSIVLALFQTAYSAPNAIVSAVSAEARLLSSVPRCLTGMQRCLSDGTPRCLSEAQRCLAESDGPSGGRQLSGAGPAVRRMLHEAAPRCLSDAHRCLSEGAPRCLSETVRCLQQDQKVIGAGYVKNLRADKNARPIVDESAARAGLMPSEVDRHAGFFAARGPLVQARQLEALNGESLEGHFDVEVADYKDSLHFEAVHDAAIVANVAEHHMIEGVDEASGGLMHRVVPTSIGEPEHVVDVEGELPGQLGAYGLDNGEQLSIPDEVGIIAESEGIGEPVEAGELLLSNREVPQDLRGDQSPARPHMDHVDELAFGAAFAVDPPELHEGKHGGQLLDDSLPFVDPFEIAPEPFVDPFEIAGSPDGAQRHGPFEDELPADTSDRSNVNPAPWPSVEEGTLMAGVGSPEQSLNPDGVLQDLRPVDSAYDAEMERDGSNQQKIVDDDLFYYNAQDIIKAMGQQALIQDNSECPVMASNGDCSDDPAWADVCGMIHKSDEPEFECIQFSKPFQTTNRHSEQNLSCACTSTCYKLSLSIGQFWTAYKVPKNCKMSGS